MMNKQTNARKELFMKALLQGMTIKSAAETVGVSEQTAHTYLKDPAFKAQYRQLKSDALQEATDYIQTTTRAAAQVLFKEMNNRKASPRTKIDAAQRLIEFALRIRQENEVLQRIETLEAKLEKTQESSR